MILTPKYSIKKLLFVGFSLINDRRRIFGEVPTNVIDFNFHIITISYFIFSLLTNNSLYSSLSTHLYLITDLNNNIFTEKHFRNVFFSTIF